jgi:hypothetical protein
MDIQSNRKECWLKEPPFDAKIFFNCTIRISEKKKFKTFKSLYEGGMNKAFKIS